MRGSVKACVFGVWKGGRGNDVGERRRTAPESMTAVRLSLDPLAKLPRATAACTATSV